MWALFLILNIINPAWAFPKNIEVVENVVIGREISVPGDRLCHDGVHIYFRSQEDCQKTNIEHSCRSQFIAPIRQAEVISIDENKKIYRFFDVPKSYEVRTYNPDERGYFDLVARQTHSIPFCSGAEPREPVIVFEQREGTPEELPFLQRLFNFGVTVINTGFGPLKSLHMLNQESHELDFIDYRYHTNIRSPLCVDDPIHENLIQQISGEYSGGGVRFFNINLLQNISGEIILPTNQDVLETNPEDYLLDCLPSVSL